MTFEGEAGVVLAHWVCDTDRDEVVDAADALGAFARRHGMEDARSWRVVATAYDVLATASGRTTTLEAATDGVWLAVRVIGVARELEPRLWGALNELGERIEHCIDPEAGTATLLLEIAC